jgi:hypothetical protein
MRTQLIFGRFSQWAKFGTYRRGFSFFTERKFILSAWILTRWVDAGFCEGSAIISSDTQVSLLALDF